MLSSLFGPPTLVGVDIGSHSIIVVEARVSSRYRFRVQAMAEVPTPLDSYVGGQVQNVEALGEAIRSAVKASRASGKKAVVAVPPQVGFLRKLAFPKMEMKELRAAIELQPERYIPFARDGAVFDLNILPGEAGEGQIWVVLAAAPRKYVLDLMAAVRTAGLTPVRVDLEPLALHRVAIALKQASPEVGTAIVDLGVSVAKISLFEGDVPVISRVLDMPRPTAVSTTDPFAGVGTEELFLDIRRSLEFALTQTRTPPTRVLVVGGAGSDGYFALSLGAYLRGFLTTRLPGDFLVTPLQDRFLDVPVSHMLALGLSLPPDLFS